MPPHHSTLSIPNTTHRLPSQERPSGHSSPGKHRRDHAAATTAVRTRRKDKTEGRRHLPSPAPYASGAWWVYGIEDGSLTDHKCRACRDHAQLEARAFVSSACSQGRSYACEVRAQQQSHLCKQTWS